VGVRPTVRLGCGLEVDARDIHFMGNRVKEILSGTVWGRVRIRNLLYRGLADIQRHLRSIGVTPAVEADTTAQ
jgi:hypothetical protein